MNVLSSRRARMVRKGVVEKDIVVEEICMSSSLSASESHSC